MRWLNTERKTEPAHNEWHYGREHNVTGYNDPRLKLALSHRDAHGAQRRPDDRLDRRAARPPARYAHCLAAGRRDRHRRVVRVL
ncbi:protein of unknown function [Pararobbsia alpina]